MFRLLGGIFIAGAFVAGGYIKCGAFQKRYVNLCSVRQAFAVLKSEISLKKSHLGEAFYSAGDACGNKCFVKCAENIPAMGAEKAFKHSVLETASENCFTKSDIDALLTFAPGLGKCDMENQISRIDYTLSLIDKAVSTAKKEKSEKGRVIMHCSLLAGVGVMLIII